MESAPPNVYDYLDHRAYLRDWFEARKVANPRYSHRLFARRAGQSSPSLLLHVIQGKRNLTDATTAAFARALELDADAGRYFTWLVQFQQADAAEARQEAWERLSRVRRFRGARTLEGESWSYLSNWWWPAIRELASIPGFRPEPEWVARTLCPPIGVKKAREAIDALKRLGLLVEQDGRLVPGQATVVTPHEVAGLAARAYHKSMLTLASECMERFPREDRHLGAVTVTVDAATLARLKDEVAAFQERVLDLCDGGPPGERVVQLNIQLFPLSAPVTASEETP